MEAGFGSGDYADPITTQNQFFFGPAVNGLSFNGLVMGKKLLIGPNANGLDSKSLGYENFINEYVSNLVVIEIKSFFYQFEFDKFMGTFTFSEKQ